MEAAVFFCEKIDCISPANSIRCILADLVRVFKLPQIDVLPFFCVQTKLSSHLVKRFGRLLLCNGCISVIGQDRILALQISLCSVCINRRIAGQVQRRLHVNLLTFFGVPTVECSILPLRSLHVHLV